MAEGSTQPPNATRFIETTQGIPSYQQFAPLLAERVLRIQDALEPVDKMNLTPLAELWQERLENA